MSMLSVPRWEHARVLSEYRIISYERAWLDCPGLTIVHIEFDEVGLAGIIPVLFAAPLADVEIALSSGDAMICALSREEFDFQGRPVLVAWAQLPSGHLFGDCQDSAEPQPARVLN